jgi:hypothetical protein
MLRKTPRGGIRIFFYVALPRKVISTQAPIVMPMMCAALDFSLSKPTQIVLAGSVSDPRFQALATEVEQQLTLCWQK